MMPAFPVDLRNEAMSAFDRGRRADLLAVASDLSAAISDLYIRQDALALETVNGCWVRAVRLLKNPKPASASAPT
jgi:hypothetical protein